MKMTHPDSKQTVDVSDDDVDRYRSQGWQDAESKSAEKDKGSR